MTNLLCVEPKPYQPIKKDHKRAKTKAQEFQAQQSKRARSQIVLHANRNAVDSCSNSHLNSCPSFVHKNGDIKKKQSSMHISISSH